MRRDREQARRQAVQYWWKMAEEVLQSAKLEEQAGLLHSAVNRAYYAAFYAATAALLDRGLQFRKHTGVRAALHREFVKKGLLPKDIGLLYDQLFEARQHGDYLIITDFEPEAVREMVQGAAQFLEAVRPLIRSLANEKGDRACTAV